MLIISTIASYYQINIKFNYLCHLPDMCVGMCMWDRERYPLNLW